ncbi:hypothetical protein JE950_001295 [Flavobacterium psychrophilum]|uniref:hypothetical protein n=1 Tax=Flavobacterium psychrophilum TaxID=96345 RepID=UPI000B8E445E|nr:hypothetical protein [Flavobacterium psychrophilum]EKT4519674.1 hypothetical protein [Flavobacterium psychrophilum]
MENSKTQKIGALIFVITLMSIVEILFFFSDTFKIIKVIAITFGAIAILYFFLLIGKVLIEE